MSRGGRVGRRGRGGRQKGSEVTWLDDQPLPQSSKPEPLFPDIDLPVPRPRTKDEIERVEHYLSFRKRVRNGPLYAVLELSSFVNDRGQTDPRAGFDPFTHVERYSSRFYKPKRTAPDLRAQSFHLDFLPRELWSTADPLRKDPIWKTLPVSSSSRKRQRQRKDIAQLHIGDAKDDESEAQLSEDEADAAGSENSDAPVTANRRRPPAQSVKRRKKNNDPMTRQSGQKRGLEAEDELPEVDQNEEVEDDGEDVPQDSEFEEESDDDANDYNAENYFDTGEGDDYEDGGGGGDDAYD